MDASWIRGQGSTQVHESERLLTSSSVRYENFSQPGTYATMNDGCHSALRNNGECGTKNTCLLVILNKQSFEGIQNPTHLGQSMGFDLGDIRES
jgi:hypothetical protein